MGIAAVTRIGVISDTHDHFDGKIPAIFKNVDHILHAGDIGLPWIILELEQIAPVTAVLGNTDQGINFKETELVQVDARKFLIHHIVEPRAVTDKLRRKMIRENPDVVVFGHTHKPFCEQIGDTLFLNPGYAGKQRFSLPRSVAVLTCDGEGLSVDFFDL